MITSTDGSLLYAFYNNPTSAFVFLFDLAATNTKGFITASYSFDADGGLKSYPILDGTNLVVPYVSLASDMLYINTHDPADLTLSLNVEIPLAGSTLINVKSVAITFLATADANDLYHVLISGDVFIYMAILEDLSAVVSQKVLQLNSALLTADY